ncbi:ImmA/IrrE family metallo-endopeptidase [Roseibium sp.]|uniref:ImmA/IrrE family metallo-endopeptidase n=1 Tax=Roseibium sp. TaxID=1936156 RepID=UPI003B524E17
MMIVDAIRRAQRQYPVDVIGLCRDLGISVHEAYLADDVSGELVPIAGGHYQINVNASHPKTRQRFTIAHELGHFVHHRNLIGAGIDDDRAYRSTNAGRYHNTMIGPAQETQANRFAANLLMPQHLIDRLQQEGKRTPNEQAYALGVSRSAMRIRLGVSEPV